MHIGKRGGLLMLVLLLLILLLAVFMVVAELAYIDRRPAPRKETSQRPATARSQTEPLACSSANVDSS